MSLLRALFFLLVAANVVLGFLNLTRFDQAPGGEPDRMSSQLHPEKMRLLAAETAPRAEAAAKPEPAAETAAPTEGAAAAACVRWVGVTRPQAEDLVTRARSAGLEAAQESTTGASSWWVHIPPLPDRATAEKKAGELQRLGVADFFIVNEAGASQNAISLGLYKSQESAQRSLEQLKGKGVQSARVTQREATALRVEVSGAGDRVAAFASEAAPRLGNATRSDCAAGH